MRQRKREILMVKLLNEEPIVAANEKDSLPERQAEPSSRIHDDKAANDNSGGNSGGGNGASSDDMVVAVDDGDYFSNATMTIVVILYWQC
ncbi:hypothetical protein Nepgr_024239 [Nepenthes gracilis]|uniref:Uncharacterized protein n=1 Tax=Nepenthes gracilis TaxID=150966 RepID=A0AAD3Y0A2_NEPGR|nr:hypothetical protein Nepgr_024239 [Nepenthes gracilis]